MICTKPICSPYRVPARPCLTLPPRGEQRPKYGLETGGGWARADRFPHSPALAEAAGALGHLHEPALEDGGTGRLVSNCDCCQLRSFVGKVDATHGARYARVPASSGPFE